MTMCVDDVEAYKYIKPAQPVVSGATQGEREQSVWLCAVRSRSYAVLYTVRVAR